MTIFKRNELTWYPIPRRILEEREALERLQETLYEEPHLREASLMIRMKEPTIQSLLTEMGHASMGGAKTWDQWHAKHCWQECILEFPSGELQNEGIAGFVQAWRMQGKVGIVLIEKGDRFSANGLEGKVSVKVSLIVGLMAYRELPEFRRALYAL